MSNKNVESLAEESSKTKKIREKLQKHLQEMDQNITPQALKRKLLEIYQWISRHASNRSILRSKASSLFDGNQNTAEFSQKISQLIGQLKVEQ